MYVVYGNDSLDGAQIVLTVKYILLSKLVDVKCFKKCDTPE